MYLYSKKKTNFSAKIKSLYYFSTYRTSYFYLKSCFIFFKLDEIIIRVSLYVLEHKEGARIRIFFYGRN